MSDEEIKDVTIIDESGDSAEKPFENEFNVSNLLQTAGRIVLTEEQKAILYAPVNEDDVEIRHITLLNKTNHDRDLDITSYVELAMAPHLADRQHPAFNKMFIQTEALSELQALLAYRRARSEDDAPLFVGHRLTFDQMPEGSFEFETDRREFIGRGGSLQRPQGAIRQPGNSQGFVLDPVLSLRRTVHLGPLERRQFSVILAAGEDRERVIALMEKYSDPTAIERALEIAWAAAQLELIQELCASI